MSAKAVLILCAQALLVKSALSQCIGAPGLAAPFGLGYDGLAAPFAYDGRAGCAGRGFPEAPKFISKNQ
ncbi:unnamed protein product [Arctia plantaginis]|uniref:Secreted protein n=1 Tax=Arctia plantaginis TaxID=874455 RepID=A0A8S1BRQ1_ARCPL|nr:unnamed protein product [Arctia plantaginis]